MSDEAASLREARRYAVMQPFIVDKHPLFSAMIDLVAGGGLEPRRIVELGVGTGGFLEVVARAGHWPRASLLGADLSEARIAVARDTFSSLGRPADMGAGVDAMDPAEDFYQTMAPAGSADVVVLSQFEHYAANEETSPLARRMTAAGRTWMTKSQLRRHACSRLRPGGWLFVIDDYAAETVAEQERWDRAWDAHVVGGFASERMRRELESIDPEWAEGFLRRYRVERPRAERLALAARARARRRHRDGEEVQSLVAACADMGRVFGPSNSGVVPHPNTESHPQFYLLWGQLERK